MVHGLEAFKNAFKDFKNHYVLIGGSACDILMDSLGVGFRVTKDLDMVLIVEELDESFGQAFWSFIAEGGYVHKRSKSDDYQFYRFEKPKNANYPKMIELFLSQTKQPI